MQTTIKLLGLTKEQIASDLGISKHRLRQIITNLKNLPEFSYKSHDKLISMNDYQIIMKFWIMAKSTSFNHAVEKMRKGETIND